MLSEITFYLVFLLIAGYRFYSGITITNVQSAVYKRVLSLCSLYNLCSSCSQPHRSLSQTKQSTIVHTNSEKKGVSSYQSSTGQENIGTILNFADATVTIDQVMSAMRPCRMLGIEFVRNQFRDLLEPVTIQEAITRELKYWMPSAKYEKADLPKVIA